MVYFCGIMVLPVTQRVKKCNKILKKYSLLKINKEDFIGSLRIIKLRQRENLCYEVDIEVKGIYRFRYLGQYLPYDQIKKNGQLIRVNRNMRRILKGDINTQLMLFCDVTINFHWDIKRIKWA